MKEVNTSTRHRYINDNGLPSISWFQNQTNLSMRTIRNRLQKFIEIVFYTKNWWKNCRWCEEFTFVLYLLITKKRSKYNDIWSYSVLRAKRTQFSRYFCSCWNLAACNTKENKFPRFLNLFGFRKMWNISDADLSFRHPSR